MQTAIKGIYQNGKIKLLDNPPKKINKAKVYIIFGKVPDFDNQKQSKKTFSDFNPEKFKRALKNAQGILTKNDADMIKKSRQEWDKRIDKMWYE